MSFDGVGRGSGILEKVPVKFVVHLRLAEAHFRAVVREDRGWRAIVAWEVGFVAFDPSFLRLGSVRSVGAIVRVSPKKNSHAQHIAACGGVAVFSTGLACTVMLKRARRVVAGRWVQRRAFHEGCTGRMHHKALYMDRAGGNSPVVCVVSDGGYRTV